MIKFMRMKVQIIKKSDEKKFQTSAIITNEYS